MDDSFFVRGIDRIGDLPRNGQSVTDRQRTSYQPIRERRAFYQFKDQGQIAVTLFHSVDRADVRMIQCGQQAGFTFKPRESLRVEREKFVQDFDRDVAPQLRIAGAINFPHPARAKPREQTVGAYLSADERRDLLVSHRVLLQEKAMSGVRLTRRRSF